MADNHHYFLAVKLPKEVKEFIGEWVETNQQQFPFSRWVHREDYHITLAFLGFAEKNQLEQVIELMGPVLSEEISFEMTVNEFGTFGPPTSPRIFWAGVKESEDLKQLQKKIYEMCIKIGFQLDKKPFKPHITIARIWKGEESFDKGKLNFLKTNEFAFHVNEIVLYETHLDKTPKYHEFARFPIVATN
ncbi:RNA ligase [Rhizophagus irregularis]|uniref:RNA ligase n=1 Tax=Rhizophagus irregularis TaxID=588596 RepID=A0A2N0QNQ3_9GLOM|nr:RNA ligase [Rhizophagus irregularis]